MLLEKLKGQLYHVIEEKKLWDEKVNFNFNGNILETTLLEGKSEGLSFSNINEQLSVKELFSFNFEDDKQKELFVGFSNALANLLFNDKTTLFCNNNKYCFSQIGSRLLKRYGGLATVCVIDADDKNVQYLDSNQKISFLSFLDKDFENKLYTCVSKSFLVLCSGFCFTKEWADWILEISAMDNDNRLVIFFGPQSAFVNTFLDLKRVCFYGGD